MHMCIHMCTYMNVDVVVVVVRAQNIMKEKQERNQQTYIDANVFAVNDFIKLFKFIAKRLHFNCYVVVYKINKEKKNKQKNKEQIQ